MGESVQMNVRTTGYLINELDTIVKAGMFRSRSEAVNEAVRLLIMRYRMLRLEKKMVKVRNGTAKYPNVSKAVMAAHEEE
ncbi:MAG: ribbon-helix-helix domain-containing protein [Thermoplasmata archaeon]